MHRPKFPPNYIEDFAPGNPFKGEPPLPRFLWNPKASWLDWENKQKIAAQVGGYAARRAEAFVPSGAGPEAVMRVGRRMYDRIANTMGLPPRPRAGRRWKHGEEVEELLAEEGLEATKTSAEVSAEEAKKVAAAVSVGQAAKKPVTTAWKVPYLEGVEVSEKHKNMASQATALAAFRSKNRLEWTDVPYADIVRFAEVGHTSNFKTTPALIIDWYTAEIEDVIDKEKIKAVVKKSVSK